MLYLYSVQRANVVIEILTKLNTKMYGRMPEVHKIKEEMLTI